SIDQALKVCADRLDSGFAEVTKLVQSLQADQLDSDPAEGSLQDCPGALLESSISKPDDPILGGESSAATGAGEHQMLGGGEGSAATGAGGGVIQSQQKATRNKPISAQLHDILEYAGRKTGIDVEIYSGGQPSSGPNRTGSHRHDVGRGLMGAA